jgi:hypothetical protein
MVEVYTPSYARQLIDGLRSLGWRDRGSDGVELASQVARARERDGPSWLMGPTLRRRPWPMSVREPDLADCFEYMRPRFIQLRGGITVLVAMFGIAESDQDRLEGELRKDAHTRVTPLPRGGQSIALAEIVKEELVGNARHEIRITAESWITDNLGGLFAGLSTDLATFDLLLSEFAPLAPAQTDGRDWREGIGLVHADRWSPSPPSDDFILAVPYTDIRTRVAPSFVGLRPVLIAALKPPEQPSVEGVIYRIEQTYATLMAIWGVRRALDVYSERLAAMRDRPRTRRASYGRTRAELDALRSSVLPASLDAASLEDFASELGKSPYIDILRPNTGNLQLLDQRTSRSLLDWLREQLESSGARFQRDSRALADALQAYSETLVAASNLRLQRRLLVLTFVVAILTGVTLWLAIEASGNNSGRSVAASNPVATRGIATNRRPPLEHRGGGRADTHPVSARRR